LANSINRIWQIPSHYLATWLASWFASWSATCFG